MRSGRARPGDGPQAPLPRIPWFDPFCRMQACEAETDALQPHHGSIQTYSQGHQGSRRNIAALEENKDNTSYCTKKNLLLGQISGVL